LSEDSEIEISRRDDGVVEIRPLDKAERMRKLLAWLATQPELTEEELPVPVREIEPERLDWDELWNGEMPWCGICWTATTSSLLFAVTNHCCVDWRVWSQGKICLRTILGSGPGIGGH